MREPPGPPRRGLIGIPEPLRGRVRLALERIGRPAAIVGERVIGGGCINHGTEIRVSDGTRYFLKWNERAPSGMFAAEADGLLALRRACSSDGVRIPEPVALDEDPAASTWLLLDFVPEGRASRTSDTRLGRVLSELHVAGADLAPHAFGWTRDNWIGSLPQSNAPSTSWGTFWRDRRIVPRLEQARAAGLLPDRALDRVVGLLPGALDTVVEPDLLHGDLWSGNAYVDPQGIPVLIDPAVSLGHGEVDLAMSELFGGFGADVYAAYREARAVDDGYAAYRRDLYQLYYLLVHVNLFGAGYAPATLAAARRVAAELG